MKPSAQRHPVKPAARQRGVALLVAMLIVTLVSTLAVGMVWQQWRTVEVESAERAHTQSAWLLAGALDWARMILREDAREGGPDALTEPWATGLEEIRLSTFLAADKDNNAGAGSSGGSGPDNGLDAFLSGQIADAQARYNLLNLSADDDAQRKKELAAFARLCDIVGLPSGTAQRIAEGMRGASDAEEQLGDHEAVASGVSLRPQRMAQLSWLGLDADGIARLKPVATILTERTLVNINTASAEVLSAVIEGADRSSVQRLIQRRAQLRKGFADLEAAKTVLPEKIKLDPNMLGTSSGFFEVSGLLRYEDHELRETTLLRRQGLEVKVLRREQLPHE